MNELMKIELMALGRLALFMVGMIVIALPIAMAWASLRRSPVAPAVVYLATMVVVGFWIMGGVR